MCIGQLDGAMREEREILMSQKLYVGNLSWNTNDDSLRNTFARFGEVTEAKVITDRETGRSRGFGFVTFSDNKAAQAAMEEMNGADMDGRPLRVNEANESRGGRGGREGGGNRGRRW